MVICQGSLNQLSEATLLVLYLVLSAGYPPPRPHTGEEYPNPIPPPPPPTRLSRGRYAPCVFFVSGYFYMITTLETFYLIIVVSVFIVYHIKLITHKSR